MIISFWIVSKCSLNCIVCRNLFEQLLYGKFLKDPLELLDNFFPYFKIYTRKEFECFTTFKKILLFKPMLIVLPEMNIFWRENSKFCCVGFLLKTIMCLPTYLGIRYLLYIRNMKRKPLFCWFKKKCLAYFRKKLLRKKFRICF